MCLGEPVDTGSPPPVWDGGDDGEGDGEGDWDGGDDYGDGGEGDGDDGAFEGLVPDEPIHP